MSLRVTQQELERELRKFVDGAVTMNISQIAKSRHWGRDRTRELIQRSGIPCITSGKSKEYLIKHIAKAMLQDDEIRSGF